MSRKLSTTLQFISTKLDGLRFAGLDQNPSGIRDLLGSAAFTAEKMERALACQLHPNGARRWADDGTMLDEKGNRSIFDDVDQ